MNKPRSFVGRLVYFANDVYEPKLHIIFASLWSLSILSVYSTFDGDVTFSYAWLIVGMLFYLVLFFLRAVDEIKDYDYDAQYKPDRPLVIGAVSFFDVGVLALILSVIVLAITAYFSLPLAVFVFFNMLYGVWLLLWEKMSSTVRENILVNLAVTFPVSSALNFFALYYLITVYDYSLSGSEYIVAIAYICAFLHYDFGRKSVWPHQLEDGEQLYSRALGGYGHLVVSLILGLTACVLMAIVAVSKSDSTFAPCVFVLPSAISLFGAFEFYSSKEKRPDLRLIYMAYLVAFYGTGFTFLLVG